MADPSEKKLFSAPQLLLRSIVSGEKCAVCAEHTTRGKDIICAACTEALDAETEWVCSNCGARIRDCICVPPVMKSAGICAHIKLFPYFTDDSLLSNRIIYRLKTGRDGMLAKRVMSELSDSLETLLRAYKVNPEDVVVSFVPRSLKRKRESGTDQAQSLAAALAGLCGSIYAPLFDRTGEGSAQKTLSADERSINAESVFALREDADVSGCCVVLVDDLVTTGSTLAGCARLLKRAGAGKIFCVSLAHTVGNGADYFRP